MLDKLYTIKQWCQKFVKQIFICSKVSQLCFWHLYRLVVVTGQLNFWRCLQSYPSWVHDLCSKFPLVLKFVSCVLINVCSPHEIPMQKATWFVYINVKKCMKAWKQMQQMFMGKRKTWPVVVTFWICKTWENEWKFITHNFTATGVRVRAANSTQREMLHTVHSNHWTSAVLKKKQN